MPDGDALAGLPIAEVPTAVVGGAACCRKVHREPRGHRRDGRHARCHTRHAGVGHSLSGGRQRNQEGHPHRRNRKAAHGQLPPCPAGAFSERGPARGLPLGGRYPPRLRGVKGAPASSAPSSSRCWGPGGTAPSHPRGARRSPWPPACARSSFPTPQAAPATDSDRTDSPTPPTQPPPGCPPHRPRRLPR